MFAILRALGIFFVYTLDCVRGERICFGGWVTGRGNTYWGVGPDNKYSCTTCCAVCGGGPARTQVLNQPI